MEGYSLFLNYDAGGGKRASQWMRLCYVSGLDAEEAKRVLEQVYGQDRIRIEIEHRSMYPGCEEMRGNAQPGVQSCGHSDTYRLPDGQCSQCEHLDRATAEIDAELKRVESGDVDTVEAWANDPKVCHGEIEKAALLSLCRQLREARKFTADLADAANRLAESACRAFTENVREEIGDIKE